MVSRPVSMAGWLRAYLAKAADAIGRLSPKRASTQRTASAGSASTREASLLQALVTASPDAIFAKDLSGRYLLFNPEAARVAGRDMSAVLGQDDLALFDPSAARQIREHDRRVMQLDQPETFEEELDTPAGRRTFLSTKGPLHDGQGRVRGLYGISRDITDMVATRRRLADSEERYRRLFKLSPVAMWLQDQDSRRFLAVNEAAEILYGYTREQLLSMRVDELRAAADDATRHRRSDGRLIDVDTFGNDVQVDGRPARLVAAFDVTERRRAQAERRAAAERFEKLFSAAPDAISLSELETGRFLQVNVAFCTLFGHAEADVIGRTSAELALWTNMEGRDRIVAQLRAGKTVRDFEGVGRRRSGELIDVSFSADNVEMEGRQCLLLVFHDITQRKQSELALRRSEQRFRLAAAGGQVWEWDFAAGNTQPPIEFFLHLGYQVTNRTQLIPIFESMVPSEDLAELKRTLVGHLKKHRPYGLQFRARDAQGRLRWFETQGQAVWNEAGRATYMAGTTFEITERRQAEQALLDSQAELFELTQRLLTQERETQRQLAQSLHDRLGQSLGSARLHLDLLGESIGLRGPDTARPFERLSQLLDQAIAEVRSTLVALRPPLLEGHGLAAALRMDLVAHPDATRHTTVDVAVESSAESQRWPGDVEHAAFMVAREAVTNALRHAGASRIQVQLSGRPHQLLLSVKDDGVGIDEGLQHGRPGHLGLVGMRERTLGIGGRLLVRRDAAGGTEVQLHWQRSGAPMIRDHPAPP